MTQTSFSMKPGTVDLSPTAGLCGNYTRNWACPSTQTCTVQSSPVTVLTLWLLLWHTHTSEAGVSQWEPHWTSTGLTGTLATLQDVNPPHRKQTPHLHPAPLWTVAMVTPGQWRLEQEGAAPVQLLLRQNQWHDHSGAQFNCLLVVSGDFTQTWTTETRYETFLLSVLTSFYCHLLFSILFLLTCWWKDWVRFMKQRLFIVPVSAAHPRLDGFRLKSKVILFKLTTPQNKPTDCGHVGTV